MTVEGIEILYFLIVAISPGWSYEAASPRANDF
jgi:hypothetical protein